MHQRSFIVSTLALVLGLQLLAPGAADAAQKTFKIGDESNRDNVSFTSDAPVELIEGRTTDITGIIVYDDSLKFDATHPFKIQFNVDLASIDTGIPLRNEHMRDNFLETKQYPKATFVVKSIKTEAKAPIKDGQTVTLNATGDFTVHGVTVTKTIPVKVTYFKESEITRHRFSSGDMIRIRATFPVKLAEHHIKRPEVVFQKLAETVYVKVDAFGQGISKSGKKASNL